MTRHRLRAPTHPHPNEGEVNTLLALLAVVCLLGVPVLLCASYGVPWPVGVLALLGGVPLVLGGVWRLLTLGGDR